MSKNKLNTMFNSIGDNAVNNENTSLDIIFIYTLYIYFLYLQQLEVIK